MENEEYEIDTEYAARFRMIDLFCGIGSFHRAAEDNGARCVFACDNDPFVKAVYEKNYGMEIASDICAVDLDTIPNHDILCGGFPCQPFSTMGARRGRDDIRGDCIDYIIETLKAKQPKSFILENVKGLLSINGGKDFATIVVTLKRAGYDVVHKLLHCEDYGIPQLRRRLFIVGFRNDLNVHDFEFPEPNEKRVTLEEYLGKPFVSSFNKTIRTSGHTSSLESGKSFCFHKMKDGSIYELTEDDLFRLQGFEPKDWNWLGTSRWRRLKMIGNSIPVCLTNAMMKAVTDKLRKI